MLIGIIDKGYEQIHIKENNGKINFIKVSDNVSYLTKEEALNLLNEVFSTKDLRYIESNNEYDIYLDSANNKRYFKNGIEDFKMFYENNGQSSVLYSKKIVINIQKKFTIITALGLSLTMLLSSKSIALFLIENTSYEQKVAIEEVLNDIKVTTANITNKYEYLNSSEQMEQYISEATNMQDFDKKCLNNEDYFNFILSIVDEKSKIYDLPDRFTDINVRYFNDETNESREWATGYYVQGTNTLNVKEDYIDNLKIYEDILDHEFIHLTQTGLGYVYIKEALAEILSTEFYGTDINAYLTIVKNVKLLTEAIGPDAVLNAVFSHDTSKFENAIREHLNEEDAKRLLELLSSSDMYTDKEKEVSNEVKSLIMKLIYNKYNGDNIEIDTINLLYTDPNRIYFNNNKEEYYNSITCKRATEKMVECQSTLDYIKERGDVKYLDIYTLYFSLDQVKENLENIKNIYLNSGEYSSIKIITEEEKDFAKKKSSGMKEAAGILDITIDENGNFIKDGEIFPIEKLIDNIIKLWDEQGVSKDARNLTYLQLNCHQKINIEDIENTKYICDNQFTAQAYFSEEDSFTIRRNSVSKKLNYDLELKSISERFDVEYLNKGKSK